MAIDDAERLKKMARMIRDGESGSAWDAALPVAKTCEGEQSLKSTRKRLHRKFKADEQALQAAAEVETRPAPSRAVEVDIPGTDSGDLELARSLVGKSPEEKARVVLLWRRAQEKTDEVVERLRDEGVYEVRPASGNPMDIIMLASILEALQESEDD